jgi:hypothetical protein
MLAKLVISIRRQWIGALALFLVLTSGVAYAANTVFSTDIVDNEVYSADVRDDTLVGGGLGRVDLGDGSVAGAALLDDSIRSADVRDEALTNADLQDVTSKTVNLKADNGETLFTIGRVRLSAFCSRNGGTLTAGIEPGVDDTGPVMVTEDGTVALQPFDVQFVVIIGSDANLAAEETSFALLDRRGTSVTGVAAASVDPATNRCVVSIHAIA